MSTSKCLKGYCTDCCRLKIIILNHSEKIPLLSAIGFIPTYNLYFTGKHFPKDAFIYILFIFLGNYFTIYSTYLFKLIFLWNKNWGFLGRHKMSYVCQQPQTNQRYRLYRGIQDCLAFALVAQQEKHSMLLKLLTELLSNKWVTQRRARTEPIPGGGFMNSCLPAAERGCLNVSTTPY